MMNIADCLFRIFLLGSICSSAVIPAACRAAVLVTSSVAVFGVCSAVADAPRPYQTVFVKADQDMNEKLGKKQYLVPYLMSSHPGSTLKEAVELAEFLRDLGYMPEQVQDFYPTPSTLSTCMFYTGVDPRNMQPVFFSASMTRS